MADLAPDDPATLDAFAGDIARLKSVVHSRIVGQEEAIDSLLVGLFARGHVLLVGVPGLAKTLLIQTLAQALHLSFGRIQFTPDLMPSDITGTDVLEEDPQTGRRRLTFVKGPLFANIVLADEVNRTPPKTQAALLQAMQEREVTAGGQTFRLDPPFFVLATQNPIEQEGTYPLPEAQLDRFMLNVELTYPSYEDEVAVVQQTTTGERGPVEAVLGADRVLAYQRFVDAIPVPEHLVRYAVELVRSTRPDGGAPDVTRQYLSFGAGPRASQNLIRAAKARAAMRGELVPTRADLRALALPILRHRIVRNFTADADGIGPERVVADLLARMDA
jgi:MoxR-like ATPase